MKIDKNTLIGDLISEKQEAINVLMQYEMGCLGCPSAQMETLEQAAYIHGIDLEELLQKLNEI
jgi:hybrid cluster-associated redox disulfide protein